jgi:hypothetical protein
MRQRLFDFRINLIRRKPSAPHDVKACQRDARDEPQQFLIVAELDLWASHGGWPKMQTG